MDIKNAFLTALIFLFTANAQAQPVPAAIGTDPPADPAHPTVVICHGLPGNER